MAVPEELADEILAACGRRCCLCTRFKPLELQIHHIQPESEGGGDEPDNLAPLCRQCHATVHTKAPFARAISGRELKLHRDRLYRLVAEDRRRMNATARKMDKIVIDLSKANKVNIQEALARFLGLSPEEIVIESSED